MEATNKLCEWSWTLGPGLVANWSRQLNGSRRVVPPGVVPGSKSLICIQQHVVHLNISRSLLGEWKLLGLHTYALYVMHINKQYDVTWFQLNLAVRSFRAKQTIGLPEYHTSERNILFRSI